MLKGLIELVILFGQNKDIVKSKIEALGGKFEDLGYGFGIITIKIDDLDKVSSVQEIQYIEFPKVMYASDLASNQECCIPAVWNLYNLTGSGVLVGFIDSGIDYTHPAFRKDNGDTRIDYIYDLSQGDKVWNRNDINKALKSSYPLSIVNEFDLSGHGTHVAGIACGGGKINNNYYGVAYNSSIAMVKMTQEGEINYAKSTQLMRGIKFLLSKSYELKKPLVINLSFSTNNGAHNGSSLLEKYIQTVCELERISFVVASGNEGDRAHHVGGLLEREQSIALNVDKYESAIVIQFYKDFLADIRIKLKNPAGITTQNIDIKQGYFDGQIGEDRYFIYNSGSKPFDINGEIVITLSTINDYILSGEWSIQISYLGDTKGRYDMWLPIAEGLNQDTKFLNPDPYNTLGIPATVENVISVGSYDYKLNSISSFSGRGRIDSQKPDIVAPGEDIVSSIPMGEFDKLSGTSMSTPHVSGSSALLMEWGIVKKNDLYMYGDRLKYFLLKGARRNKIDVTYPGPIWGYGELCVEEAMKLIKGENDFREIGDNLNQFEKNKDATTLPLKTVPLGVPYQNLKNVIPYIIQYSGDLLKPFVNIDYAYPIILDDKYAIVYIESDKAKDFLSQTKQIVYIENITRYTLTQISPLQSANILKFHDNPFLTLRGTGVVVAIIDTGIDYLNKEFMYENGTTRIIDLWDQTLVKNYNTKEFGIGSEFNSKKINDAIRAKNEGKDPYSIVNSKDEIGHGTHMAGIIGARGINPKVVGAAPDCKFAIVKLKPQEYVKSNDGVEDDGEFTPVYSSVNIILALKHIYNLVRDLEVPTVIYVPLGTNEGAHDGSAILERYIDHLLDIRGVVVVTSCGNQGNSDTHTYGIMKQKERKTIELKVDDEEKDIQFEVWCNKPDKVSLGIVSPSGQVVDKIPARLQKQEEIKFLYEGSTIFVKYSIPEEITGDELIKIRIENVKGGIWKFILIGDYIINGRYDAWLPQRVLIKDGTRFLKPYPDVTLTIPSTANKIISCAYYDQNTDTVVGASGKGYTRDLRIKPDIAAGGINVSTIGLNNTIDIVSGASVGAAVTAGAVALLLQWGIVDGNDPTMYATKIKTYLIRGAKERSGDTYPNREWGYGLLNLDGSFNEIR